MAVKFKQKLNQSQTISISPKLQQSIKLLSMARMEMTQVISKEMTENPLLEEREQEIDVQTEEGRDEQKETTPDKIDPDPLFKNKNDDFDWSSYIESFNSSIQHPSRRIEDEDNRYNYENIMTRGPSLNEHLAWQLKMKNLSKEDEEFCLLAIHNIDDDGRLDCSFQELLQQSGIDERKGRNLLDVIQQLDPIGCGAENIIQCLLGQAKASSAYSPLLELIVKNHLNDIYEKNYDRIIHQTGYTQEAIESVVHVLQDFHPMPGRLISEQDTYYVVPDIYVKEAGGKFEVLLNDEGIPSLKISSLYRSMLKSTDKKVQDYVKEKLQSAMWLIKSIGNRRRTIYRVAESIVHRQQEFFRKGKDYLRPMILRDVAGEIDMHESTVSRVTTNKYMHTPIGLFELKYFFNTKVGGKKGNEDMASRTLKEKITKMIDQEDPKRPLSDQRIMNFLKKDNIDIARRTVTKYREQMGVPKSNKRKKA